MYTKILARSIYTMFYISSLIGTVAVIWFYESLRADRFPIPLSFWDILSIALMIGGVFAAAPFFYYCKKYYASTCDVGQVMFHFLPVAAVCFTIAFFATCKEGLGALALITLPAMIFMSIYEVATDLTEPATKTCQITQRSDPACPG